MESRGKYCPAIHSTTLSSLFRKSHLYKNRKHANLTDAVGSDVVDLMWYYVVNVITLLLMSEDTTYLVCRCTHTEYNTRWWSFRYFCVVIQIKLMKISPVMGGWRCHGIEVAHCNGPLTASAHLWLISCSYSQNRIFHLNPIYSQLDRIACLQISSDCMYAKNKWRDIA